MQRVFAESAIKPQPATNHIVTSRAYNVFSALEVSMRRFLRGKYCL